MKFLITGGAGVNGQLGGAIISLKIIIPLSLSQLVVLSRIWQNSPRSLPRSFKRMNRMLLSMLRLIQK